ncbi:hypothetical protein R3P38DRAFT_2811693 [Favolaschia claudopus]|uniref:Uncharacterized protein n=1 Tax=Favolaschia claudopus TaxID=2862362 RepID=A0AAV9Z8Q3_9AGAR
MALAVCKKKEVTESVPKKRGRPRKNVPLSVAPSQAPTGTASTSAQPPAAFFAPYNTNQPVPTNPASTSGSAPSGTAFYADMHRSEEQAQSTAKLDSKPECTAGEIVLIREVCKFHLEGEGMVWLGAYNAGDEAFRLTRVAGGGASAADRSREVEDRFREFPALGGELGVIGSAGGRVDDATGPDND